MSKPGSIILTSDIKSRYKLEIFPRIWLKSDKPSLWARVGYALLLGKTVVKLPPIETCTHNYEIKETTHATTGRTYSYRFCSRCENEEEIV